MFDALETGISLQIVLWFQDNRFGLLEIIAKILDFAGEELFYVAIFGLIYWMFNKKLGLRMLLMLVTINTLVFFFKDMLGRPRPYLVSDAVMPLFTDLGNGLPSGHTASSIAIWGYFAWWFKRREITIIVVIYVLMQAIFRMVAGVHFPQDVIGGLVLGGLTLAAYIPLAERFAQRWANWSLNTRLAVSIIIPILMSIAVILFVQSIGQRDGYLTMTGLLMGFGLGVIFEERQVNFVPHPNLMHRIAQYILGLAAVIIVLFGLSILFNMIAEVGTLADILRVIRYGSVGFVALGLWPYLSIHAGLMKSEHKLKLAENPA